VVVDVPLLSRPILAEMVLVFADRINIKQLSSHNSRMHPRAGIIRIMCLMSCLDQDWKKSSVAIQ